MKKILFVLVSASLLLLAGYKKFETSGNANSSQVDKKQSVLVLNYTATWCPPCGSIGAPLMKECLETPNVVTVKVHTPRDPMYVSSTYNQFLTQRTVGGTIPSFWVNDVKTDDKTTMRIVRRELKKKARAGLEIEGNRVDSVYQVKVGGQHFVRGKGEFFLSVWLLESGIDGGNSAGRYRQAGAKNANFNHNSVFRTAATSSLYGEVVTINPAPGEEFEKSYHIKIDPTWQNNVFPIAILWQYNPKGSPPNYKFINAIK